MSSRSILTACLLINAALIGVVIRQARQLSARALPTPGTATLAWPSQPMARAGAVAEPRGSSSGGDRAGSGGFNWTQVESSDYRTYMANLRAIGCPESTIRDIIGADVTKMYMNRIAGLRPMPRGPFKYWDTADRTRPAAAQQADIEPKTAG